MPNLTDALAARFDSNAYDPEIAKAAQEWLNNAPTAFLLCRNDHRFPRLVARNGKLPGGVTATPLAAGSCQIRQRCPDCGTIRVFTYTRGTDLFAASRTYHYEWPPGYRQPKGAASYINVADCRSEAYSREGAGEMLLQVAAEIAAMEGREDWDEG